VQGVQRHTRTDGNYCGHAEEIPLNPFRKPPGQTGPSKRAVFGSPALLRILVSVSWLSGCGRGAERAEIERLEARVDSLTFVVTGMKAAMDRATVRSPPKSLTLASTGVAALGKDDAPVTIIEFTDYQCPFCGQHARVTFPQLRRDFIETGQVHYILRDLPLPMHPFAVKAARAARCAAKEGPDKFWRYHDALFAAQGHLADSTFSAIARELHLNVAGFIACQQSIALAAQVQRDQAEAMHLGLTATPSFVIGPTTSDGKTTGRVLSGAMPTSDFQRLIREVEGSRASAETQDEGTSAGK
jgi:protein-disulfide isomerase